MSEWVSWDTTARAGYARPLAYKSCPLQEDSIFSVFLMAIKDVLEEQEDTLDESLQRYLVGCSYVTGGETHVMDQTSLEDYEYPKKVMIPANLPKTKRGKQLRFLFMFHRFVDNDKDTCSIYALGFLYLREPMLEFCASDECGQKQIVVDVSKLRNMREWARWIAYLRWVVEGNEDASLEEEYKILRAFNLVATPEREGESDEEVAIKLNKGYFFVSTKKPCSGMVGREELVQRIRARLYFYNTFHQRMGNDYSKRKYAVAFQSSTSRDRSIDFIVQYILCIMLFKTPQVFSNYETSIFLTRMRHDLVDAESRQTCLRVNGIVEEYAKHVLGCEHSKNECLDWFLKCQHFSAIDEMTRIVKELYFVSAEEDSEDESAPSSPPPKDTNTNKRSGKLELEDVLDGVEEAVQQWLEDCRYI